MKYNENELQNEISHLVGLIPTINCYSPSKNMYPRVQHLYGRWLSFPALHSAPTDLALPYLKSGSPPPMLPCRLPCVVSSQRHTGVNNLPKVVRGGRQAIWRPLRHHAQLTLTVGQLTHIPTLLWLTYRHVTGRCHDDDTELTDC